MHCIAWGQVQRMLIDAPRYLTGEEERQTTITTDNAESFIEAINGMI